MKIEELLAACIERKASDLHLSAGLPPLLRIDGDLIRVSDDPMSDEQLREDLGRIMGELHRARFKEHMEVDFSTQLGEDYRFRVNAFEQSRGIGAVARAIPAKVPTHKDFGLPDLFLDLVSKPRGLVLVTGPTGSGKSTTLAALVDYINETSRKHVITIEDPIEFIHKSKNSLINQRELGAHTLGFRDALRSALREDPDIILVGEMRDLETMRLALTAAETGHLVLGTLHTSGAAKTVNRIIDVFPPAEKETVRAMLSESLEGVITQALCKRKEGSGRVAAFEIMIATVAIRNMIREGKIAQMLSAMQTGSASGMQTLDQALSAMVKKGQISAAEARTKAIRAEDLAEDVKFASMT